MTLPQCAFWKLIVVAIVILSATPRPSSGQTAVEALRFDEANLKVLRVLDDWAANPLPSKSENGTLYSATHRRTGSIFVIANALVGPEHEPTADMLADELINDYAQSHTIEIRSTERSPKSAMGVNGLRVVVRGLSGGEKVNVVAWVGAMNGREYRFSAIVPGPEATAVVVLNDWLAQLQLIDPNAKVQQAALKAPEPFVSERFGYTVALPAGTGWRTMNAQGSGIPSVEYAAGIGGHTYLIVQALYLGGPADPEQLAKACSAQTANPWDATATATPMRPHEDFPGVLITRDPSQKGELFHYRSLIVGGRNCAFVVMGWTARKDQILAVENAVRSIRLERVPNPTDKRAPRLRSKTIQEMLSGSPNSLNPAAGLAQNVLGLNALAEGRPDIAVGLFEAALDERLDPIIGSNLLQALYESGQLERATELLPLMLKTFRNDDKIASQGALIYEVIGRPEDAIELYRIIFPDKVHDDERFARFIDLLLDRHDTDLAKRHIAAYKKHTDNDLVAALEAEVLIEMNETAKAIDRLKGKITTRMPNERLLMTYCKALVKLERADEAAKVIDTLESDNGSSPRLLIIRGHTFALAGDFEKAKTAYEGALRLKPNDPEIKQLVRSASSYVGQGFNAALKTEILPIALPDEFLQPRKTSLDKSAGAGYRLYAKATQFEAGKRERTTTYQVIELYDQNGVDAFNMIRLDLNPLSERIFINALDVLDENGQVIERGKPETYFIQDREKEGVASFKQEVNLPVPALRPGYSIRLVATREQRATDEKFAYSEEYLGHRYPTALSVFAVSGDVAHIKSVEANGVIKDARPGVIVWSVETPHRVHLEPLMPPPSAFVPMVVAVDARTGWDEEASDYLKLIQSRLEASSAVRQAYEALNIDAKSPTEKLRAIVDFVDTRFTYTALAFGPRARVPTEPAEILRNRYGDCKDMSLLTHLLLREAGIESHLTIARMHGTVTPELPSLDQFDHMIVNVPDCDGSWWIDCTGDNTDPLVRTPPPIYLEGRHVLVLDGSQSRLVQLPNWDASSSNVFIDRVVRLMADGRMNVSDKVELNGAIAHYYRSSIRAIEASQRESQIVSLCALRSNEIRDYLASADSVDDYLKPLTMHIQYSPRRKLRTAGTRLVGDLPNALENQLLAPELLRDRQTPMSVQMGMHVKIRLSLELPSNVTLEGVNLAPQVLTSPYGKGEIRFSTAAKGFTGELNVQSPPLNAPAAEYERFCEWRQSVLDTWSIPLVVTPRK